METYVDNQPILNKILENINDKNQVSQAYLLVHNNDVYVDDYLNIFSKILICPNKYNNNCKKCNICERIDKKIFNELKIIDFDNDIIKKDEILNIRNTFQTNSIESNYQVYIIKNIEKMNKSSSNALLKFLEEPDSNTVAIFTTNNLDLVLETIISRCQIIKLNNLISNLDYQEKNKKFPLNDEQIKKIFHFIDILENNYSLSLINITKKFLNEFENKEELKSVFILFLMIYKEALNKKILNKLSYFIDYKNIIEHISGQHINKIYNKINFIMENLNKLDYNINVILFLNNFFIGIEEINNDKSSGN